MFRFVPLLILLSIALTGCGETSTTSKAVAIVDLEVVAQMTGSDLEMQKVIQERNSRLGIEVTKFKTKVDAQWKAKKEEFGEKPTEEQQKELNKMFQDLSFQSNQIQNRARQNIAQFQQEVMFRFREQLSPISLEVAKEHGYSIVLVKNPMILTHDVAIDITDQVVERMKELMNAPSTTPSTAGGGSSQPAQPPLTTAPPVSTTPSTGTGKSTLKLPEQESKPVAEEKPASSNTTTKEDKKPEAKPEVKVEPKPETKTEPKVEAKPKPEPAVEKKPEEKKAEN